MDPLRLADASFKTQRDFLLEAVFADPAAKRVIEGAHALGLPDPALMAGAIYGAVWNALTGRAPGYGINDYDLAYHDAGDLGEAAEDRVIRRAAEAFADLDVEVEVRNQARVHIWFGRKFDVVRAPVRDTCDAIAQFASHIHSVGVRLDANGAPELLAPWGLAGLFRLQVHPVEVLADPAGWNRKCDRQGALWPEVSFHRVKLA
jgi:uncharacterized protein